MFLLWERQNIYSEVCPQYEKVPRNKWQDRKQNGINKNNNVETKDKVPAPINKTKKGKPHFQFMTYKPEIYNTNSDSELDSDDEETSPLVTYDSSDSENEDEDEDKINNNKQHIFTQFDDKNM